MLKFFELCFFYCYSQLNSYICHENKNYFKSQKHDHFILLMFKQYESEIKKKE